MKQLDRYNKGITNAETEKKTDKNVDKKFHFGLFG